MASLSGTVCIEGSKKGLAGAMVKAVFSSDEVFYTISDAQGHFQFDDLKPGQWKLVAMKEDYHQRTAKRKLNENDNKKITINLIPVEIMSWNTDEFNNLHQAAPLLKSEIKKKFGLKIPIEVYVQDPYVAKQAKQDPDPRISKRKEWKSLNTIWVPCEPDLMRGPTNSRIAVVDYDGDTNKLEDPVEWDNKLRRFYIKHKKDKVWLTADHSDTPQFHQVNIWAIVQSIIDMYEETWIMGRSAPWAFEGNRLILVPHAGETRNAYYDRNSKSIQFYYFHSNGKKVYTCLSHDIIAHETGHAMLDGLRPLYLENSSLQTAAFHEFIADLTAILSALLNNELRWEVAKESEGDLAKDEIISSLAEEFGYYSYGRPYLRTAQDQRSIADVQEDKSPYEWSQVLTGAMFDILKEIMAIRKTTPRSDGRMPKIKEALMNATNRFRRVAFQPLDYLPPVDVQFDDYVRAVLRADEIVDPLDEYGYRAAMETIFKKRGFNLDVDDSPERLGLYAYDIDRLSRSKTDAYHFINENRRQLCIPMEQDISVVDLYRTAKTVMGGGKLPREIVIQYMWREDVELKGTKFGALEGEYVPLLCGGTLVFDSRGNVLSWQRKPGSGKMETGVRLRGHCKEEQEKGIQRRDLLLNYLQDLVSGGAVGLEGKDRPDAVGLELPMVASHGSDGSLRLHMTPYLRHWAEK